MRNNKPKLLRWCAKLFLRAIRQHPTDLSSSGQWFLFHKTRSTLHYQSKNAVYLCCNTFPLFTRHFAAWFLILRLHSRRISAVVVLRAVRNKVHVQREWAAHAPYMLVVTWCAVGASVSMRGRAIKDGELMHAVFPSAQCWRSRGRHVNLQKSITDDAFSACLL